MSLAEKVNLSVEDYLKREEAADSKHEYQNGEAWVMAAATHSHLTITLNLACILKQHLKNKACRTYISDMKVRVEKADAFFYPDVLVTCNPKDHTNSLYKQYPQFIAEVLSPSTEDLDRGDKFNAYRQLESLETYWLISTESQRIDSFTRTTNDDWQRHSYTQTYELVEINGLNVKFLLPELYEDTLPD